MHCLYFIRERKFYARTHVKITQHWKSTLRQVVRKQVSFQDRKKENKPKFSSIEK